MLSLASQDGLGAIVVPLCAFLVFSTEVRFGLEELEANWSKRQRPEIQRERSVRPGSKRAEAGYRFLEN